MAVGSVTIFSGCQPASDSDELDLETLCMLNRLGANSTLSDRAAKLYELEVNPTGIALGWDGPVTTLRGEEMVVSHGIVGLGGAKDVDGITETIQLTAANRDRPVFLSVGLFGLPRFGLLLNSGHRLSIDPELLGEVFGEAADDIRFVLGNVLALFGIRVEVE
jgi:hypothetical protein